MEPAIEDHPYMNRELDEMFGDIKGSMSRIETQTIRTNGRVTVIERWQYSFMGGIAVLTIIVVPLLAWALYVLSNIQETVHKSVDEALSAYDIEK